MAKQFDLLESPDHIDGETVLVGEQAAVNSIRLAEVEALMQATKIAEVSGAIIELPSVPHDEEYQFCKRSANPLRKWNEPIGPSDTEQTPTSASLVIRNEGGNQNGPISVCTRAEYGEENVQMAVTSRRQARSPAANSSQRPRVSTAGGELKDTTPPRLAAGTTGSLSSPELALLPDCPKDTPSQGNRGFKCQIFQTLMCAPNVTIPINIHRSPFRHMFSLVVDKPEGIATSCDFYTPRILQLWEAALRRGDFESFFRYAEARTRIPRCNKLGQRIGGSWWVVPGEMPSFQVCKACYNDFVIASPFAGRFARLVAPQDGMYCSLRIPGLQKQFLRLFKSPSPAHGNTWQDFVLSANHRIGAVPDCPSAAFVRGPRAWWACKKVIPDFAICEACYLDMVEPSQWHEMFAPTHQPSSEMWNCSFAYLPIQISWDLALSDAARDFDDLWECAWAATTLPPCEGQVINGGEWFKLFNVGNFSVCHTCYHT